MKTGTDRILMQRLRLLATLFFAFLSTSADPAGSAATRAVTTGAVATGAVQTGDAFSEYSKKADALIAEKGLKKSRLGLVISFLPSGAGEEAADLYRLNEDRLFIPASLVKTAALSAFNHYFPPGFRFQTRLLTFGAQTGDRLQGDLIVQGGGDPGFTSEYLWSLVNAFQRTGVKIIEGDILADDSLYKPFLFEQPSARSHYALPSAASFNWNSVAFWLAPPAPGGFATPSATRRASKVRPGGTSLFEKPSSRDASAVDANAADASAADAARASGGKSSVKAAPAREAGAAIGPNNPAVQIHVDPENSYVKTANHLKTGRKTAVQIRFLFKTRAGSNNSPASSETFSFTGSFNPKQGEKVFYRAVRNPPLWLGNNLLHFLKRRGVSVTGAVKTGAVQTGAVATGAFQTGAVAKHRDCLPPCQILASHKSRPLLQHTYNMMKYSNNFVTRMLTSHLPLIQGERRGDFKRGVRLIENYLSKEAGLSGFRFHEPTGLSRENRFSPAHFKTLLLKDRDGFLGPEALSSYPLAAAAGTLEKRFQNLKPGAFVRAKTGSLEGVTGLAGFAQNSSGERFVFVFIYNGPARRVPRAEALFAGLTEAALQ